MRKIRQWAGVVASAAVLLTVGYVGIAVQRDALHPRTVVVPSPTEDSADVQYVDGRWLVDGVTVQLHCPTEDSCTAEYEGGAWTFAPDVP